MNLTYVPLLQIQRELQGLPRNHARFRQYLRTISPDGATLELPPLGLMNPMGKDHVTALLDALLALDADGVAARAAAEAAAGLADDPGEVKAALVVVDDLKSGWTNRYATEFTLRFRSGPPPERLPHWAKHFWVTAVVWSSEPATERAAREAVLTAVYRLGYVRRHGPARTLRAMLAPEGRVMALAGWTDPALDADDL